MIFPPIPAPNDSGQPPPGRRRPSLRRRNWAIAVALTVLAVGASLPVWSVYSIGPLETTGKPASLWRVLARVPANWRAAPDRFWSLHETNLAVTSILLLLTAATGWAVYRGHRWLARPDVAGDYGDGPGGAVPDGRTRNP